MAASKVKAWQYTTPPYPDCLQRGEVEAPMQPPTATSIIVRMRSVALNPVDIQLMNLSLYYLPFYTAPKIPCEDFSGEVLAAGAQSGFKKGDAVFGMQLSRAGRGTLTEVQAIDTATSPVLRKPEGWSFAQAAAVPLVWLTARTCIERVAAWVDGVGAGAYTTAAQRRKLVVLGGSSATGMYTVLLARQRGWEVLSTCSSRNADFVCSMGAAQVVDYTKDDVPAAIRAFGPAATIDCVGGTECLGLAPRYVTIVGDKTSRASLGGPHTYYWSLAQNVRWLRGRLGWGEVYDNVMLEPTVEYLREATDLKPEQIYIDSEVAFDEAKKGFERLHSARARGKVVVNIQ